jgi:heme-degrading monooxygenase HmoA
MERRRTWWRFESALPAEPAKSTQGGDAMIVVLFSVTPREDADVAEEAAESERMWRIVSSMPGFISYKAYAAEDGEHIVVVRFESREALDAWKKEPEHRVAQERGRTSFYQEYWVQASETFRQYRFVRGDGYGDIPRKVFLKGARPVPVT